MNLEILIDNKDYEAIEQALASNPVLANEGIPYDEVNIVKAHPLHRICDRVFSKKLTDEEAVIIAGIFLAHGAHVDGGAMKEKADTPLIAAASLQAERVGILYLEHGANIHHAGCHGGTALHWAAWCGQAMLLKEILQKGPEINKLCIDFRSTPLFWAIHGYWSCGRKNLPAYVACTKLLLEAGANKSIPNFEGYTVYDMLDEKDTELVQLLDAY